MDLIADLRRIDAEEDLGRLAAAYYDGRVDAGTGPRPSLDEFEAAVIAAGAGRGQFRQIFDQLTTSKSAGW
jgi:hypothetical protein